MGKHWADELPDTIRVGAFDFKLSIKDAEWDKNSDKWGQFSADDQSIFIARSIVNSVRFIDTLLHEINHAIYWTHGIKDEDNEERIVGQFSSAWVQIYRDNPWLLKWLIKWTA